MRRLCRQLRLISSLRIGNVALRLVKRAIRLACLMRMRALNKLLCLRLYVSSDLQLAKRSCDLPLQEETMSCRCIEAFRTLARPLIGGTLLLACCACVRVRRHGRLAQREQPPRRLGPFKVRRRVELCGAARGSGVRGRGGVRDSV